MNQRKRDWRQPEAGPVYPSKPENSIENNCKLMIVSIVAWRWAKVRGIRE